MNRFAAALVLSAALCVPASARATQVVFLDFDGGWVSNGPNSAQRHTDTSVRAGGPYFLQPYADVDGATRGRHVDRIFSLVQGYFARFDVAFVIERPSGGSYTEIMIGGDPHDAMIQEKWNVQGAAPIDENNSDPNNLGFVFTGNGAATDSPEWLARAVAHELGHTFGLQHTKGEAAARAPADIMCEDAACVGAGSWEFKDAAMDYGSWPWSENTCRWLLAALR